MQNFKFFSSHLSHQHILLLQSVLKTIIRMGKLQNKDMHLVATIVKDAEKLKWRPGQLERRRRAIQAIMSTRTNFLNAWNNEDDDVLRREIKSDDALFKRKGWNEVDSGFRLWGGGKLDLKINEKNRDKGVDEFLVRKGWNDVDSGFRII